MKLISLVCVLFLSLFSQNNVVSWNAKSFSDMENTFIEVSFEIDKGYHVYGTREIEFGPIPTSFSVENEILELIEAPEFKTHFDEGFELNVEWISGKGRFVFKIAGVKTISEITTITQACTETSCLPPKTEAVKVENGPFSVETNTVKVPFKPIQKTSDDGSLLSFILLSIGAGFLALLTPCVFPMIPITVSFFIKNAEESRMEAIKQGLIYGLGIVSTFTIIGFFIAFVFGAGGVQNFAANPFVNIFIGLVFIAFALSLFGMFEIQLPYSMTNKINAMGMKPGNMGIIFAGIAFSLVSFTCSAPVVGSLLVKAAYGDIFLPVIGMFFFSVAFAFPFVLLAIFPQLIAQMPKSGGWLHATKVVLGFVEVAAAIKFFSQADLVWNLELITRPFMLISWGVLFLLPGIYLLGMFKLSDEDTVDKIGVIRLFNAMIFIGFSIYLFTGLSGKPLQADLDSYMPPSDYGVAEYYSRASNKEHLFEEQWIEDYDFGLKTAKQNGKLLFVDFTGKTCTNCRWMEKNIFTQKKIQDEFKKYNLVRLWTDFGEKKEVYQDLQMKLFNTVALPFYAIIDGDGNVIKSFPTMTRDVDEFAEFLK